MSTLILKSGDSRPWFADFLKKEHPGKIKFHRDFNVEYKCVLDKERKLVRDIIIPSDDKIKKLIASFEKEKDKMHIIGVMVTSKSKCEVVDAQKKAGKKVTLDMQKHWYPLIINPDRKVGLVYQPHTYHLESPMDFFPKKVATIIVRSIKDALGALDFDMKLFAPKTRVSMMQRVKTWCAEKMTVAKGMVPARIWYPLSVLWEIHSVIENPNLPRSEVIEKALAIPTQELFSYLEKLQQRFERFYVSHVYNIKKRKKVCEGMILNPSTGKCAKLNSEVGRRLQGLHPSNEKFMLVQPQQVLSADSQVKTFLDHGIESDNVLRLLKKKYPHATIFMTKHKRDDYGHYIKWTFRSDDMEGDLEMPPDFMDWWKKALANKKYKQLVVFVGQYTNAYDVGHANVMMYNKPTGELEIFEPNGLAELKEFGTPMMYEILEDELGMKLLKPADYCPRKMSFFQTIEASETSLWNTEGYCAAWSVWYAEQRMSNPQLKTKEVVEVALGRLLDLGSLRDFIWNYDRQMRKAVAKK